MVPIASGKAIGTEPRATQDSLRVLNERLSGIIDNDHHKNITDLTSQVTRCATCSPTSIARRVVRAGADPDRLEAIVQDGCRRVFSNFQFTLSNGKRPDIAWCTAGQRPPRIDAKFPLEAVDLAAAARTSRAATGMKKIATQGFANDVMKPRQRYRREIHDSGPERDPGLPRDCSCRRNRFYAEIHDGSLTI